MICVSTILVSVPSELNPSISYYLLQFHAHAASEHSVGGAQSELEVHFVHQAADGEYAVVGVMCSVPETEAMIQAPTFWSGLVSSLTSETTVNINELFTGLNTNR